MTAILVLLWPKWLAWKNDFRRGSNRWARRVLLLTLGGCFWLGIYHLIRRVLFYFQSVHDLGPALAYQLLLIILLTFLSMLLFSNLVTALSAFFLARDLDLLLSMPVSQEHFYYSRLLGTTANSSWMVLFFSLPIFAAYGAVFGGGPVFYLWVVLCLPLLLLIPAAFGVLTAHLFVYFLPAKRMRDLLFFAGLFGFIVIYFLFRFSQPERLVHPESFGHFVQFLAAMETPSSAYLPSSWAAEVFAGALFARDTDQGFYYALMASYALFLPLVTSWVSSAVYLDGWSKAQESRQARRKLEWLDRLLAWLTRPFSPVVRAIMIKDVKTFMRDATQWSQVFLLAALIVVYLYNFRVLPLDRSPMPAGIIRTVVAFANLALAGFVLSAVAMRFAFPAVSLEGRAFWILQSSPISLKPLLWGKFWLHLLPLLLLGELLVCASNLMLGVAPWMMLLSGITVLLMAVGITAICVGAGAIYPKFDYEHAAEIPTSFGGAICMIFSVAFIGLLIIIEAGPIYLAASHTLHAGEASPPPWTIVPCLLAATALTIAAVVMPINKALACLEAMKD